MRKIVLKENLVTCFGSKHVGIEAIKLEQLIYSLSLFLKVDVRQVPFEPLEPVELPFVVYQFYKVCNTKDQKLAIRSELKHLSQILLNSGYFLDCFFQSKKLFS